MDLLCFCSVLFLLCLCARLFICVLWSPAGKGLTSWLSFVVSNCEFVTFPLVSWVGVWYLIESIPDLCTLTYFYSVCILLIALAWMQEPPTVQKGATCTLPACIFEPQYIKPINMACTQKKQK